MNEESRQPESSHVEPDWDAIARVVAGESSSAENSVVSDWLAANPADAEFVAFVKSHGELTGLVSKGSINTEAALVKVRSRIAAAATVATANGMATPQLRVESGNGPSTKNVPALAARWWHSRGVQAGLAIAAVAVLAVSVRQWSTWQTPVSAVQVVATPVGQRDSVTLHDGTRVVLAPGSQLTVAAGFDNGDRTVELQGAAYFDVHHDEARPFTVRAAGAVIRDVGTAFTVKTDDVGGVSIAVTHGTVAVGSINAANGPSSIELNAGDRGVVSAGTVAVTRGIVLPEDAAWTKGELSYRDTPLSEVQADLKRWYGISLRVADSSLTRLTVTMPAQPDSASFVRTLAALLGASAEQHGDTVILRAMGTGTTP